MKIAVLIILGLSSLSFASGNGSTARTVTTVGRLATAEEAKAVFNRNRATYNIHTVDQVRVLLNRMAPGLRRIISTDATPQGPDRFTIVVDSATPPEALVRDIRRRVRDDSNTERFGNDRSLFRNSRENESLPVSRSGDDIDHTLSSSDRMMAENALHGERVQYSPIEGHPGLYRIDFTGDSGKLMEIAGTVQLDNGVRLVGVDYRINGKPNIVLAPVGVSAVGSKFALSTEAAPIVWGQGRITASPHSGVGSAVQR